MSQNQSAPVLRPTWAQFLNFPQYVEALYNEIGTSFGICKVIPPAGWWKGSYDGLFDIEVTRPVYQHAGGERGIYKMDLVESKTLTVQDFIVLTKSEVDLKTPNSIPEEIQISQSQLGHTHPAAWPSASYPIFPDTIDSETTHPACSRKFPLQWSSDSTSPEYSEKHRQFWRSVRPTNDPPLYGADVPGTHFPSDGSAGTWNLNSLDTILSFMDVEIPGVTHSMLYFGSWRAMFAWHKEDMDLCSISYLHLGKPKSWYCVPPIYATRLENLAQVNFASEFNECSEHMRHKTTLISPKKLQEAGIPFSVIDQNPGEFVITFPKAYHQGFNHGFNCAEAVNFAFEKWIAIGRKAKTCKCRPDSVSINMSAFNSIFISSKFGKAMELRLECQQRRDMAGLYDEPLCLCRRRYEEGTLMIQCDVCDEWCHPHCAGVCSAEEEIMPELQHWYCPVCAIHIIWPTLGDYSNKLLENIVLICNKENMGTHEQQTMSQLKTALELVYGTFHTFRPPLRRCAETVNEWIEQLNSCSACIKGMEAVSSTISRTLSTHKNFINKEFIEMAVNQLNAMASTSTWLLNICHCFLCRIPHPQLLTEKLFFLCPIGSEKLPGDSFLILENGVFDYDKVKERLSNIVCADNFDSSDKTKKSTENEQFTCGKDETQSDLPILAVSRHPDMALLRLCMWLNKIQKRTSDWLKLFTDMAINGRFFAIKQIKDHLNETKKIPVNFSNECEILRQIIPRLNSCEEEYMVIGNKHGVSKENERGTKRAANATNESRKVKIAKESMSNSHMEDIDVLSQDNTPNSRSKRMKSINNSLEASDNSQRENTPKRNPLKVQSTPKPMKQEESREKKMKEGSTLESSTERMCKRRDNTGGHSTKSANSLPVKIWDKDSKACLPISHAPLSCNLSEFLESNPHCEVYIGQDGANSYVLHKYRKGKKKGGLVSRISSKDSHIAEQIIDDTRIMMWHKEKRLKVCGSSAPHAKNLVYYLLTHPEKEVYCGQDKHQT